MKKKIFVAKKLQLQAAVYFSCCLENLFIWGQSPLFQTPVLGLGLGVDFTFAEDNHKNHNRNHKNHKNVINPHLNFVKGTVLGDKEQGVVIRDNG